MSGLELLNLSNIHRTAAYRAVTGAWDEPVALACSGGIDSTALLLLAVTAHRRGHLPGFIVTHVDHRSREDSPEDADHIKALCAKLDTPFESIEIDKSAPPAGESIESWWREQRYLALHRVVQANALTGVATAHTRTDQVESVLIRLLTGMGGGIAGMMADTRITTSLGSLQVIRPLLDIAREQLIEVLQMSGCEPLIDPSNRDTRFLRNRIRHEIVPVLEKHVPGFESPLLRASELARRDADCADPIAESLFLEVADVTEHNVRLKRACLVSQPPAIGSRIVRQAIETLSAEHDREVTFERIEAVRLAAAGRTGAIIELPGGMLATITRKSVVISGGDRGGDV